MSTSTTIRVGNRVAVRSGLHTHQLGQVLRREGAMWIVRLDSGITRQFMSSSLRKVGDA